MFASLKIGTRLVAALVILALATVAVLVFVNNTIQRNMVSGAEQRELRAYYHQLTTSLDAESQRALSLADTIASIPEAQAAFAAQDRERLSALFVPGFEDLKKNHGVRQFQFHLPPAVSFFRVHKPEKYGDDLSGFRFTVIETNAMKKKVSGLEVGVAGLGMRGVTPVLYDGKHIGSVEFGLSFGQPFFDAFKENTGAEAALLVRRDGKFSVFASTFPENFIPVDAPWLNQAIEGKTLLDPMTIGNTSYAAMAMPVSDYAGKPLGVLAIAVDRSFFTDGLSEATQTSLFVALATLLGAGVLAFFVNRSISGPIILMTGAMHNLAEGELNTAIPAKNRKDEIGEMAEAMQVFKDNALRVKEMEIEQEKSKKRAAEERRAAMNKMANEFESTVVDIVEGVSSAATEMEATSQSMSSIAENTTSQANQVSRSAEHASSNVETVASAAEELSSSIAEISRQASHSSQVASQAVNQAQKTHDTITGLVEAARQIGEVVSLITDIADQTNLLALNATIEAARAGDAGKGFAVVASEVKNLATQTGKATEEIRAQITGIQNATQSSADAIEEIARVIGEINQVASAIASAVEEQGAATQEIARNVEEASRGTNEVSTSIASVTQAAGQAGESSHQVLEASHELAELSASLKKEIETFLEHVREE